MLKVIARMLDEHGTLPRVFEKGFPGKNKGRARAEVEKSLRETLVEAQWNWKTLIIEVFNESDRQALRLEQRTLERRILNDGHGAFPCGKRTAYLSHLGGDGSALRRSPKSIRPCDKDLNLLYGIFESVLKWRPSVDGNASVTLTPDQLDSLKRATGFDSWFLQNWLRRPKDLKGVIKRV